MSKIPSWRRPPPLPALLQSFAGRYDGRVFRNGTRAGRAGTDRLDYGIASTPRGSPTALPKGMNHPGMFPGGVGLHFEPAHRGSARHRGGGGGGGGRGDRTGERAGRSMFPAPVTPVEPNRHGPR